MKRVQEAIVGGKVDSRWEIKRHDPGSKKLAPKGSDGKQAWPKDQYGLAATFKNASGAPLLSFGVAMKGTEQSLHFASFATKVGKHNVQLNDINRDHDIKEPHYAGGLESDGKVSAGDELWIDGLVYQLQNKGHVQGYENEEGVFVLSGYGGQIDVATTQGRLYHGLEFKRDGDQWKFFGPPDRSLQGQEIEAFLNELEKQYGQALTDAIAHLK